MVKTRFLLIQQNKMKEWLILHTKSLHLTCNGNRYVQNDCVAMGLPLGMVLANSDEQGTWIVPCVI